MRYLSICSGIEAASVAWHQLGWTPAAFSEIEPFPRAVLAHRFPGVPLHGDFTTIRGDEYGAIDLLVGGTPCQSFSVAGLRGGLDDDRGNLALEFLKLARRTRAKWLVWENVPGVLSSNGGRDFGAILGGMVELGYGFAYRVLDAQYFGVPQRRRRVFVVGHLGSWRRAAAVLFERHSLSGNSAPRREAGQGVAPTISARPTGGGGLGTDFDLDGGLIAGAVTSKWAKGTGGPSGDECQNLVAFTCKDYGQDAGDIAPTLRSMNEAGGNANAGGQVAVAVAVAVRRLTPRECERLQGFPDGWTLVPYRGRASTECADGPRYKAIGNSMAVPVMRWIGERIQMVEGLHNEA
jgi:DNA (cytosine-5)-methyltransferase 1